MNLSGIHFFILSLLSNLQMKMHLFRVRFRFRELLKCQHAGSESRWPECPRLTLCSRPPHLAPAFVTSTFFDFFHISTKLFPHKYPPAFLAFRFWPSLFWGSLQTHILCLYFFFFFFTFELQLQLHSAPPLLINPWLTFKFSIWKKKQYLNHKLKTAERKKSQRHFQCFLFLFLFWMSVLSIGSL